MSASSTTVAVIASTLSATAAWSSAALARSAIRRTHRAFVWPDVRLDFREHQTLVWVRVKNEGPGLAQDVVVARLEPSGGELPIGSVFERLLVGRCSHRLASWLYERRAWRRISRSWSVFDRTKMLRALPAGEGPPDEFSLGAHVAGDDVFSVVVRWTDTGGQRWQLVAPQEQHALIASEVRLRRWWWQWWRDPPDW